MIKKTMHYPSVSGYPDPYERIAQRWMETQGYITTTSMFYWAFEKSQRGYRDIDILGFNGKEMVIVNVTTNLDDKTSTTKFPEAVKFFELTEQYLKETPQYSWLVERPTKRMIFYFYSFRTQEKIDEAIARCKSKDIELKSFKDALKDINKYLINYGLGKTSSPIITLLALLLMDDKREGLKIQDNIKVDFST